MGQIAILGQYLKTKKSVISGIEADWQNILAVFSTTASVASINSGTAVMAGLAVLFTPTGSGVIQIDINADGANSTSGDGGVIQIRYGTGGAPANGAAVSGTAIGTSKQNVSSAANAIFSIGNSVIVGLGGSSGSPLTPGTTYWIDVSQAFVTGGVFSLTNIDVTIVEL